ncbi:FecR family protein [Mucilaginibacter paludis]|uniref:Anti-FecI sigma factor, FecR n=1 Tax=Mucilaginibacter paludis DSM 18603 TaxID=714943 RepID=H1YGV7_9SPHI|nr:FecR family protein [Mucilaginibacter paludis]EHQ26386.1 anti-FecI sigma factor, FecR [Mucilaginibacter paludis DSM 18603]
MDKKEFTLLVKKYLAGNATDVEKRFVEAYYEEQDSGSSIDDILSTEEIGFTGQEMFQNIHQRLNKLPDTVEVRRFNWKRYAAVAAMLTAIVSVSIWFFNRNSQSENLAYNNYHTKRGNLSKIILSDGTLVWLNADSKFRCPQSFDGATTREVYLEGEAYFEVAKDKKHPFLVHTRNLTTKVLGTKFNVNAYDSNKAIEVTLLEGKVMLTTGNAGIIKNKKQDTLYLKPNEKAYFNGDRAMVKILTQRPTALAPQIKDSGANISATVKASYRPLLKIPVENAAISASWRVGHLVFDNEPLQNVIASLSRKYDVSINAKQSLLNFPVSLNLADEPLEEVLLEITKQLKHDSLKGGSKSDGDGQFKKVGSEYYIE